MALEAAKLVGAGLATISIRGAGVGVGLVFASRVTAIARNPSLRRQLFTYTLRGFARTEAIARFGRMMAFLIRYS